ncbi:MAG: carbamoyltransferase [Gemmatimonadaceae bacterium]|nr:carbamoyltransferase [Gemmatimonadaceae bacterium]
MSPASNPAVAPRYVLGISAFYHDSAACLLSEGKIVAAAQEERFTRIKGDESFPAHATSFCLSSAGISAGSLEAVVFYEKPLLKFERLLETYLAIAPRGFSSFRKAAPLWMKERLYVERAIRDGLGGYSGKLLYAEHHESHAASAFFPSPFHSAAILTIDGVGEWATAAIGHGQADELTLLREMHWPDSLGLLYSAFTYHAGFRVNSGEYKLMGLAPYGQPRFLSKIYEHLIDLREDGSFRMRQNFFDYMGGLTMTNSAFADLFEGPPRVPESPLTQREMDMARSVQDACEEIVLRMANTAHKITGEKSLCIAGGVGLNAVANGRVLRESPFSEIWIQPAAGDAGGALGAAMLGHCRYLGGSRPKSPKGDHMHGAYLGPEFSEDEITHELNLLGAKYQRLAETDLLARTAALIGDGKVIGWFQGRMEFGPRALGARSILADPRNPRMQAEINLKIKFREGFRPFAPSVLLDRASDFFDIDAESPYMLVVAPVAASHLLSPPADSGAEWGIERLNIPRSDIPAVTHLDGSARIQTVDESNWRFYMLLKEFERLTGCPVLVNTSFNVRGEPIVCSPADAYRCLMRTNLDYLAIGNILLSREEQPPLEGDDEWQKLLRTD